MPSFNKDNYQEFTPVSEGDYPFTVVGAVNAVSTKNNDMINLELSVDTVGRVIKVYDRLVFTDRALGFIKGFCLATGLTKHWDNGSLEAEDCLGAEGLVHLELGEKKDDGKQYMEVGYYLKQGEKPKFTEQPKKQKPAAAKPPVVDEVAALVPGGVTGGEPPEDDTIPF